MSWIILRFNGQVYVMNKVMVAVVIVVVLVVVGIS